MTKNIRKLIRSERDRQGWGVRAFARELGYDASQLNRWFDGEANSIRTEALEHALKVLGLEIRRKP